MIFDSIGRQSNVGSKRFTQLRSGDLRAKTVPLGLRGPREQCYPALHAGLSKSVPLALVTEQLNENVSTFMAE